MTIDLLSEPLAQDREGWPIREGSVVRVQVPLLGEHYDEYKGRVQRACTGHSNGEHLDVRCIDTGAMRAALPQWCKLLPSTNKRGEELYPEDQDAAYVWAMPPRRKVS